MAISVYRWSDHTWCRKANLLIAVQSNVMCGCSSYRNKHKTANNIVPSIFLDGHSYVINKANIVADVSGNHK